MGKNKGKKKQQSQSEQPAAAASSSEQPGSSRESSQSLEQPNKRKTAQQHEVSQPAPQRPGSGPQGEQHQKGKKVPSQQEKPSQQGDWRSLQQDIPVQQQRAQGRNPPGQQPQRQQGSQAQQQSYQQAPQQYGGQAEQQQYGAPAWRMPTSGPPSRAPFQPPGFHPGQAQIPQQQAWAPPQAGAHGPRHQVFPPGLQPSQGFQGPPQQAPPQQAPPSQQVPRGPRPQKAGKGPHLQQPQQSPAGAHGPHSQAFPSGLQPAQSFQVRPQQAPREPQEYPPQPAQSFQGPPQQAPPTQQPPKGAPPKKRPGKGQQQQQQQQQTTPAGAHGPHPQAFPSGLQPAQSFQGPSQQAPREPQEYPPQPAQSFQGPPQQAPPTQQPPKDAPPKKRPGKGQQQQQQQQQTTPGQQPSRSSAPPVEEVTSSLAGLELTSFVSNTRRSPGKKGRVIKVESNHLQLNLGSLKTAYHYDVNIEPDKPKKFMRPVVTSFIRSHFPNRWPAFDGKKNLYTARPLSENLNDFYEDEVSLRDEDNREKKYKVEIKFANKVDLSALHDLMHSPVTPQEAIQVVDIVLRMAPVESCYPVGRSFFVKPQQIIDLGQGMEMYHGFYQSAIRGWKPLLNVDVAHKAFPKDICVVDALVELLSTGRQEVRRESLQNLHRDQEETLEKYIKTLRVTYQIPNHPESKKGYRVNGIGQCAQNARFTHDGRQMTIVEYFQRYKNYKIRFPSLPTLWVGNMQRVDKILLPLELCYICEGQGLNRKMTDLQTSKMIRHAATDTATRKNKIMQGVNRSSYNNNPCVKEFGFSVGNEFQKLDARVLNPPELQYANRTVRVSRGVWRNDSFLSGVTINKWTFVNAGRYGPRPDEYKKMADLFERSARECGMVFAERATEPYKNIPGRQSYSDIEQYFRSEKGKFDVIFVIVPESGPQYSFVKKAAEIVVGCLTQCIKLGTVGRKMNQQTAVNILLKVNSKLNGINHTFSKNTKPQILGRPVMIMGADVTHPGPDARDIPSVAAVTASHDPKAFQYNICWRLQNPKVEIIEDLDAIVQEHLKFFYKKTRVKPEAIVFFRDGVSEGQFEQVRKAEIRAIRSACKKLQAEGYEPKITFLVVQKRHHTRLFPLNPRDSEDRNINVPAGTCVDTDITHPFMQDFYLVSHASIQGVAKPTKYCTLWDDNDMDHDQVEELAYYLCHMFSRCNRSVSYPAPTYYAHLAAARAKVYIENDRLDMNRLRQEFGKYQIKDEIRKDLPMFFV